MAVLPPDPIFSLKSDMGFVHCLCFPPPFGGELTSSPNRLLAGTESGFLYIWNLETNRVQHRFEVGPSVLSIQHTNTTLITQEKIGLIKIWQRENECQYTQISELKSGHGFCRCILAEDKYLASAQEDSVVEIYDLKSSQVVSTFKLQKDERLGNVMSLKHINYSNQSVSQDYILAGYESGDLIVWDPKQNKEYVNRLTLRECITSIDYDTINGRGVAGNATKFLQVFNLDRKTQTLNLKCELQMTNDGCNIVKIRNDRKVFVTGGWDGQVRIYSWKSLRPLAVLTEHRGTISDIAFSNAPVASWKKMLMAVAGQDEQISLWDLYN